MSDISSPKQFVLDRVELDKIAARMNVEYVSPGYIAGLKDGALINSWLSTSACSETISALWELLGRQTQLEVLLSEQCPEGTIPETHHPLSCGCVSCSDC